MPEFGADIDDLCKLVAAGVVDQAQRLHAGLYTFCQLIVSNVLDITFMVHGTYIRW